MNPKKYTKTVITISVVAVVIIGIVLFVARRGSKDVYETFFVERGSVIEEISATGSISPMAKIRLQPEVSGKVVEVSVSEGDEVSKGDVLLKIGATDIESQLLAQRAAVQSASARLAELISGPTQEDITLSESAVQTAKSRLAAAESAATDAETALTNAEKNLANTEAKAATLIEGNVSSFLVDFDDAAIIADDAINRLSSPLFTLDDFLTFNASNAQARTDAVQTRSVARLSLKDLKDEVLLIKQEADLMAVEGRYQKVAELLDKIKNHLKADGNVLDYALNLDPVTLSTYKQNVNSALNNVSSVKQRLANDKTNLDLQKRLNDADITAAEISVSNAMATLTAAEFSVQTSESALAESEAALALKKTGARPETISAQQALVSAESAKLTGLENELSKRQIIAPADAVVTLIAVEEGETVNPSTVVVVLNAVGALEIVVNISEIDIARLAIGNSVRITLDAFSEEEVWSGTVVAIQPAETVVDNVIFYETKVKIDDGDGRLRSGMTANLDIETQRKDDVLFVPYRAVRQRNGENYVEILDSGVVKERTVTPGLETDNYIEITNGLSEGDEVIVFTRDK